MTDTDKLVREIEKRRNDKEFMARIRASIERNKPILDRLAEDDGPITALMRQVVEEIGPVPVESKAILYAPCIQALIERADRPDMCPNCGTPQGPLFKIAPPNTYDGSKNQ